MKTKWMISVRSGEQRRDFIFEQYELETPQDTYNRVVRNAKRLKEKHPAAVVDIISRTMAFKPRGEKPHESRYWCPYCIKWRIFRVDETLDANRCSICGISDGDFYVRKYNNLWGQLMGTEAEVKVVKTLDPRRRTK